MHVRNPFLSIHNIYSTHVNTILATPCTYTDICTCVRSTGYVCCRIYTYAQRMELTHTFVHAKQSYPLCTHVHTWVYVHVCRVATPRHTCTYANLGTHVHIILVYAGLIITFGYRSFDSHKEPCGRLNSIVSGHSDRPYCQLALPVAQNFNF